MGLFNIDNITWDQNDAQYTAVLAEVLAEVADKNVLEEPEMESHPEEKDWNREWWGAKEESLDERHNDVKKILFAKSPVPKQGDEIINEKMGNTETGKKKNCRPKLVDDRAKKEGKKKGLHSLSDGAKIKK